MNNPKSVHQTLLSDNIGNPTGLMNYIFLIGIVFLGFGLRYYHLAGNLYSDEVWINTAANSSFSYFYQQFIQDWVHPPLFHFLARALVNV